MSPRTKNSAPASLSPASAGRYKSVLRALLRNRSAILGLVILIILTLVAIFAGVLAPYDPVKPLIGIEDVKKRQSPCIHLLGCPQDQPQHLFGIDGNVRDEFSRVLYGARLSLIIGFVTVTFAIIIGTILGLFSGYLGGWVDNISMRSMDVLLAFPSLLLAIAIVTVLGPGLINALLAIGIVSIPIYARLPPMFYC
jgi:peptide/nickel transport system permease protein